MIIKKILESYERTQYITKTASEVGCSIDTVRKVLRLYNVEINKNYPNVYNSEYQGCINKPLKVLRLDKNTDKVLEEYESIAIASHWLVDNGYAKTYNGGVR